MDFGLLAAVGDQGAGSSASAAEGSGPVELDPDQAFTLDDLAPAAARISQEQRLALLAEYEQVLSRGEGVGRAWRQDRGITSTQIREWRRFRDTALLPIDHPELVARLDYLSAEQKAALVQQYRGARAVGQGEAWLAQRNLTKLRMTRWGAGFQQAAVPSTQQGMPGGPGAPAEFFPVPVGDLGLLPTVGDQGAGTSASAAEGSGPVEIDPGQELTLDDLAPATARISQEQRQALLAEYEQALSRGRGEGTAWRRGRGITKDQIRDWRRFRDTALLPIDHPDLAARLDYLSDEQKAALVQQYREAKAAGQGEDWLAQNNLTKIRMTYWGAGGQPAAVPSAPLGMPGGPGAPAEFFPGPVDDFGLVPAVGDQGAGSSAFAVEGSGPVEIGPGQAFASDGLAPAAARFRREQGPALLAEYEQAFHVGGMGAGRAWMQEHGITRDHIRYWRKLRDTALLPIDHPELVARLDYLSPEQKAALVQQYHDARDAGQGEDWLAQRNLTRKRMTQWGAGL